VEVVVYDILGRRVRTLVDDKRSAGVHEVQWNGLNELGQPVASGMYIAQMTAGNTTRTIKMTVIR
jgi:flagellar hook assembly protein FlgD